MKILHRILLASAISVAAAGAVSAQEGAMMAAPNVAAAAKIDTVLAGDWRSDKNKARDQYRHPKQTLLFFGVKPNQTVIELVPGGGWYTEVLAPLLKDNGHYIAAIFKPKATTGEAASDKSGLRAKIAGDQAHYAGAQVVEFDGKAPVFGAPASADVVLTFRNVHNWTDDGNAAEMFKAMFAVLKPGGTLGIVDHRAKPGTTLAANKDSGYLPEDVVIKLATDAGFKLAGKSEINANPKDTKDYPKGVWTLPPVLALKDQDKDEYLAIGESDRMTIKFIKPAASK
jgi:predicted methyltransferase